MMETFALIMVLDIRDRVYELHGQMTSLARLKERLRDEYFDEDTEWVTRRSFLD